MKRIILSIESLFLLVILVGCSVHGTDQTEQSRFLDYNQMYNVQVEVHKDLFVIANSINVQAVVDGNLYPLNGHGEGFWSGKVPGLCKTSPMDFSYQIDWKYLALIIPISDQRIIPDDGTFQAQFNRSGSFQAPDELLLYGTSVISRTVEVKALEPSGLTILDISIGPPLERCNLGNCTGAEFTLSGLPNFPKTLKCGDSAIFNVNFGSTVQSAGTLIITTDRGRKDIPLSGKIFIFS